MNRARRRFSAVNLHERMLLVIRALAVLLALQVSGLAHFSADVLFHDDCSADCSHEKTRGHDTDSDCPPGCPTCHACTHAQAMYVPRAVAALVPPTILVPPRPNATERPHAIGFHESVYRPPRA